MSRAMATLATAISSRMAATDVPCIVQMQQMLRGKKDVLSLAQGIVHWPPPETALAAGRAAMMEPDTSLYGPDDGLLSLRDALKAKLAAENGIHNSDVMVTAGANQAYTNVVLTLMDAGDAALLFRPYYFNHLMALQMTGSAEQLVLPPSLDDLQPDLAALQAEFEQRAADPSKPPLRLVTLVNPGNPTGVMIPKATLEAASALCARHSCWLVVDNTYEHFAYADGPVHECIEADHVLNVFSFSKAFGMMGWRVGYVAFPPRLGPELFKVQDTIASAPQRHTQPLATHLSAPRRSPPTCALCSLPDDRIPEAGARRARVGPRLGDGPRGRPGGAEGARTRSPHAARGWRRQGRQRRHLPLLPAASWLRG